MILITGGFGFQGYHLTKSLLDDGVEVRVLSRDSDHAQRNYSLLPKAGLRVIWGDVSNAETVRAAMRGCALVVHLAAQINVDESMQFPERSIACNITGTMNVLESARLTMTPVIIASSCEVYGAALSPLMDEHHPLNPRSPYAASKAAGDRMAYAYHCSYGLPVAIVRPGNVYGWGQKSRINGAVIAKWMQAALNGENITLNGDGLQGRDFVHVFDVVAAYRGIIASSNGVYAGEAYNLGTGHNTTMREVAQQIADTAHIDVVPGPSRAGEVKSFMLDSRKALSALKWAPRVEIKDGLQQTWEEATARGGF